MDCVGQIYLRMFALCKDKNDANIITRFEF